VRSVLDGLRTLPTVAPDPAFRSELRQQLVAVAPRLVVEGAESASEQSQDEPRQVVATARRTPRLRRAMITFGAAAAVIIAVFGGALWLSTKAVPGDSLYSLKRASENVQLSFTRGDTARGKEYLKLAGNRAAEVQTLLSRSGASALGSGPEAATISARTADLIRQALNTQDSETQDGSRLLTSTAVRTASPAALSTMLGWGPAQISKLQGIAESVPAGALRERVLASANVGQQALTRAKQLSALVSSPCLTTATTDSLGPVPGLTCVPAGSTPGTAAPGQTTSPGGPAQLPSTPSNPVSVPTSGVGTIPTSGVIPTTVPTLPGVSVPPLLPSLPPLLPSTSISAGTAGLCVVVLGITVNVGNCH
jgi:predicted secreted protein